MLSPAVAQAAPSFPVRSPLVTSMSRLVSSNRPHVQTTSAVRADAHHLIAQCDEPISQGLSDHPASPWDMLLKTLSVLFCDLTSKLGDRSWSSGALDRSSDPRTLYRFSEQQQLLGCKIPRHDDGGRDWLCSQRNREDVLRDGPYHELVEGQANEADEAKDDKL